MRVLYSFPHRIGGRADLLHGLAPGRGARRRRRRRHGPCRRRSHSALPEACPRRPDARARQRPHPVPRCSASCARSCCTTASSRAACRGSPAGSTSSTRGRSARSRRSKVARQLGIPTVLERPNAHTRFAYEVVRDECERLGVAAAGRPRARLQRGGARARGGRVRARRPAAVPVGLRGADVRGPGRRAESGSSATSTATTRRRFHPGRALREPRRRPDRALRRRRRRPQGPALRARRLAAVAGLARRARS